MSLQTVTKAFLAITTLAAACGDDKGVTPDPDAPVTPDAPPIDAPIDPNEKLTITPISATGHDHLYGAVFDAQGNLFATGQVAPGTDMATDYASVVAKFTPAGVLDTTFGTNGYAIRNVAVGTNGELFRGIAIQSDGKIVVSGTIESGGSTDAKDRNIALLRLNANGTTDTGFGTDGVVTLDLSTGVASGNTLLVDSVWGLALYPDDRIVLHAGKVRTGAADTDFALVRLSKDGVLDDTFADHGVFSLNLIIPDATNGNALKNNNASPRNLLLLPGTDGIIGCGYQPVPGRDTEPVVYKVTDAGILDTTFGGGDGVFDTYLLGEQAETYAARLQGTKLVTTGYGQSLAAETADILSLRLNGDGTLDTTYGNAGMVRIDVGGFADNSRNLTVLPDNRVLLSGGGRSTSSNVEGFVGLLTPDGHPDTTFSPSGWKLFNLGGPADFLWSLTVSPDAKRAAFIGFKGVGANPTPATANDDSALLMIKLAD